MNFNPVGAFTLVVDGFFYGLGFSIALGIVIVLLDWWKGPRI